MFFRDQLVGKYKVLATVGSGGFGTVYLAEDTWLGKQVALKVPHRQSADFGEFLHEPRLLARLSHPNIVTVLSAERQDGVYFIVMEYVPGQTLEALIQQSGALDIPTTLDYTCQMANALDHAHRHGILHRDLRPSNVLVTATGMLKVADFGTSRVLELAARGTTVVGSPPYMAPEQFAGEAVFASDLYALGVTMFQMLTGELPYPTPTPADIARLARGELHVTVRSRNPRVPAGLDAIVSRAMAPSVDARYPRADALLDDVLALRSGQTAPPPLTDQVPPPARPSATPRATPGVPRPVSQGARPGTTRTSRVCTGCRRPLHALSRECPFCGERA